MAHLWRRETNEDRWAVIPLESDGIALSPHWRRLTPAMLGEEVIDAVILLQMTGARGNGWVLISATDAEVGINGLPLMSGIRVLSDRDEISIGGCGSYFFSTETLAAIEPFAGADRRILCPRCKDEIAPGDASVKCPQCRLVHHQSEDRPCWTYAVSCAACSQRSDLDADYRWTPEAM